MLWINSDDFDFVKNDKFYYSINKFADFFTYYKVLPKQ